LQVEERLDYLSGGAKPKKNIDVMKEIYNKLKAAEDIEAGSDDEKMLKKKKKRAKTEEDDEEVVVEKKKKKKKKVVVESESD
jgi:hypothetical protein